MTTHERPHHRPAPPPDLRFDPPPGARRARLVARTPADQIQRFGVERGGPHDLYHAALTMDWRWFVVSGGAFYLALNALFGLLYLADPHGVSGARPGSFTDAFFFSVQTIATIGYGAMAPVSVWAHMVVTLETLVGLTLLAVVTGVVFARVSRPTARILFSRHVVVTRHDGQPTLMLRVANQRRNQILQAQASLVLVRDELTVEGERVRRFHDLRLVRAITPIFAMSFTVMHVIDAVSPLYGATAESLAAEQAELVVIVSGIDETMSQTIHARWSWESADILFGRRLVDIMGYLPDGRRAIDYTRFHQTEPGLPPLPAEADPPFAAAASMQEH